MHVKKVTAVCLSIALLSIGVYTVATYIRDKNKQEVSVEMLDSGDMFASDDANVGELYDKKIVEDMINNYNKVAPLNSDIIGWIRIPNTNINYPILSGNNNYYLNRTYDRRPSKSGSIFLDENQLSYDLISLIHGHNMLNGTMFSDLRKFGKQEFADKNNVLIYDGEEVRVFQPISFLRVKESATFKYNIKDREELKRYANELAQGSLIVRRKEITDDDVVILNTCVSDGSNDHNILIAQEIFE